MSKQPTDTEVAAAWEMFESAEPDISTERLIEQTAQHLKINADDVCAALHRHQKKGQP